MNDNELLTDVFKTLIDGNALTISGSSLAATTGISANTISAVNQQTVEDRLDEYVMNRITVDHKVTAQELLKLQEVSPTYASEIKEDIAKEIAREVSKKVSYKKKHDKDTDVHHFIGRVWVFSEDELKSILGIK